MVKNTEMTEDLPQNQIIPCQIIESQYFGAINWCKILFQKTNIKIAQYEPYPKTSFRNRTVIAGSNGLIILSVPLQKGRSQKSQTKDVKISYEQDWQTQHLRSIVSCYGKSPFFEFYQEGLENLFCKKHHYLIDLNLASHQWVFQQLKSSQALEYFEEEDALFRGTNQDLRDQFKPSAFQLVKNPVRYFQVFEDKIGFQANLSILDLLFCMGPASKTLL